jgi:hypothetical protein
MKRLMFGSIAVLCLALAFHLGAEYSRSCYVDHVSGGIIAVWEGAGYTTRVLDDNGDTWGVHMSGYWEPESDLPPLPVPVQDLKFWSGTCIVTQDNGVWRAEGTPMTWTYCGHWPGGSATSRTSWGKIKAGYRDSSEKQQD